MAQTEVFPRHEGVRPVEGVDVTQARNHLALAQVALDDLNHSFDKLVANLAIPRVERSRVRSMRHKAVELARTLATMRLRSENWDKDQPGQADLIAEQARQYGESL